MNFSAHATGGAITATAISLSAVTTQVTGSDPLSLKYIAIIWATGFFFSLYPDTDTSSIPQRWFFRGIFILLVCLFFTKQYSLATFVALISILPLLDHHRSWTHHPIVPFIFPFVAAASYEYFLTNQAQFSQWSIDGTINILQTHLWLVIASIVGWYTHLALDYVVKFRRSAYRS